MDNIDNLDKPLHKCKIGTYNSTCVYKVNKIYCSADHCGFMGEEVTAPVDSENTTKAVIKHEPKWFEKYYH